MSSFLDKVAEGLVARIVGPMSFRFILQPLVAVIIGVRDGLMDAKAGLPPYIIDVILNADNRKQRLASAFKSLLKPIIIGTLLDMIAQYLIMGRVRLIPALIVGVFVMSVPYSLARGITNRIVTLRKQKTNRQIAEAEGEAK